MKEYQVVVNVVAENESDLIERLEDCDNPISSFEEATIKVVDEDTRKGIDEVIFSFFSTNKSDGEELNPPSEAQKCSRNTRN